ncbi:MAG: diguanylate cyclase [Massilia sp.]|nr:diguanylate cyclase [Massilia sp.]
MRLLARCCLLALPLVLVGVAAATPTSDLRFKRLGALDANDLSIMALLQDRQGFIWIGTNSAGLYRYDGYQASSYLHDPRNQRSLPSDRVLALFEDPQGQIWAGTQDGVARFHPASGDFTALTLPPGPSRQRMVKAIIGDGANGMWVATWGGLQHVDSASGAVTLYTHDQHDPASLGSNDLNALAKDAQGGLWIATWPGGLDYLAPGATRFLHYRIDTPQSPDDKQNIARSLYFAADGTLWIGTENGIVTWDSAQPWSARQRIASPPNRITTLYGDRNGAVWAGTIAAGLLRWDKGSSKATHYVHRANDAHSLQSDHIPAVLHDRGGILWVGSFTNGISQVNLNSRGFERVIPFDSAADGLLRDNAIRSIDNAPGGRLWLGSNAGIALFDPAEGAVLQTWRSTPKRVGALSNNTVYSLYQQPGGPLWAGTSAGLNRLERPDGAFQVIRFAGIAAIFINVIAPGAGATLWLGTGQQVVHYDIASGKWSGYPHNPLDPFDTARRSVAGTTCIVEDTQGRVWMGSEWNGGGLDLLDVASGTFRHFRHDPADAASLAHDNVSSLYQDPQGRLWAGTGRGVQQVLTAADGAIRFRSVSAAGSVGAVKILAMRSARSGMLWLSTAKGLLRLDPGSGKISSYSTADGLSEGFALNGATAAPDGVLYFSGLDGMTGVHPDKVHSVSMAPHVAITDIRVFNRSLAEGGHSADVKLRGTITAPTEITLSARQSVFSLEFSALHYTDPARNAYAYRLSGFDRDWVQADANHRSATYTNLDPGSYRFEVKAANEQGNWSAQAASVTIHILPPWWRTWWCRLLALLLSIGLLALAYRVRVRSLTRRGQQLQALVAARTVELEASNAKLAELSNTDALTGITNRRGFDAALAAEWRRAQRSGHPLALAMLDVDYFKGYNDAYGHQGGDQCLRAVAALIAQFGRRTGELVARYGGEEFALLAPATDAEQAVALAESMCRELERLALPHAHSPYGVITVSIGVAALVPGEDNDADTLVRAADLALYRAKQAGRNRAMLAATGEGATHPQAPADAA